MKKIIESIIRHEKGIEMTVAVLVVVLIVGYGEYRRYTLVSEINSKLDSTTTALEVKISAVQKAFLDVQSQNASLSNAVQAEVQNRSVLTEQAGKISDAAATLDKLSKIDPQLLQKYSKVYFLNENYIPANLTLVNQNFLHKKSSDLKINSQIDPFLQNLLDAQQKAGLSLRVISAYRSFGTQAVLKSSYSVTYGAGTANSFSADQGYSEHQLGTALDFTNPTVGDSFEDFEKTPEYGWLIRNAHQYGFVLSYPKNNTYYQYEPWHWRFVGVDLATKIYREGKNFYDMDQRTLSDYLAVLFN
ncbi:MAG: M15 family metallopeptidase [Parcubacteria group bacterium]|nr:M15 family metallopeptidase [Parcubacteria group bacterium]